MLDRNGGSWNWVDEDGCSESIVRHVARSMSHLYGESFTGDISGVGRIVVPLLNQAYKIGKKSVFGDEVALQPGPQKKLTEHEIRWVLNALSRLGSLAHLLNKLYIPVPKELAHINVTLQGMHKHGTSDGKPYVDPPIPEGYRKANADEYKRRDVQFWHLPQNEWVRRPIQGDPFDPPNCNTHYIVPIDPPLTDEDACVWPRRLVMVRNKDYHAWEGPFQYVGRTTVDDDDTQYSVWDKRGYHRWYAQARRATPEEIEAAK